MRVLITNDDGIDSPGLRALADMARGQGHDVAVAAPCWDSSGSSSSVTGVSKVGDVVTEPRRWTGWPDGSVRAVDATPALIALMAVRERFGAAPDIVLSGINRGANTGRAILHSGTVGAAFTAFQHGCPALAVSLAVREDSTDLHWATAADVACRLFKWMSDAPRPAVVNCNVPDLPLDQLKGIRQGRLDLLGTFQTSMTEQTGRSVPTTVTEGESAGEDTEGALLERGFACVTALIPVVEDAAVDFAAVLE